MSPLVATKTEDLNVDLAEVLGEIDELHDRLGSLRRKVEEICKATANNAECMPSELDADADEHAPAEHACITGSYERPSPEIDNHPIDEDEVHEDIDVDVLLSEVGYFVEDCDNADCIESSDVASNHAMLDDHVPAPVVAEFKLANLSIEDESLTSCRSEPEFNEHTSEFEIDEPVEIEELAKPADDLTLIKGISADIEQSLNQAGIARYEQIAVFSAADVKRISALLADRTLPATHSWIEQASLLSLGELTSHAAGETDTGTRIDWSEICKTPAIEDDADVSKDNDPELLAEIERIDYRIAMSAMLPKSHPSTNAIAVLPPVHRPIQRHRGSNGLRWTAFAATIAIAAGVVVSNDRVSKQLNFDFPNNQFGSVSSLLSISGTPKSKWLTLSWLSDRAGRR